MFERCNTGACAGSLKGAKTAHSVCTVPTHAASCFDLPSFVTRASRSEDRGSWVRIPPLRPLFKLAFAPIRREREAVNALNFDRFRLPK